MKDTAEREEQEQTQASIAKTYQILGPDELITALNDRMSLYTERMHVFKRNKLKECLLILTNKHLFLTKLDGNKMVFEPINFATQLDCIVKCLKNHKRETCQALAIHLKNLNTSDPKHSRSHLILVQSKRENFYRLVDFMNYHIYSAGQGDDIMVSKKSQFEKFEIVENNRHLSFCFQDIGFHRIENQERKLNIIRKQSELKDILLKRINGIISNHWVNCFIELKQPSAYALCIIKKFESPSQNAEPLKEELE